VIAVVGGRGVIGRAIVEVLSRKGHELVVVTHSRSCAELPGHRYGDLLLEATLPRAVEGAEVVVQSANFGSYPMEKRRRGQTFASFDAEGTERLVAAAQAAGSRRYVFISGAGARTGGAKPYWDALRRGEAAVLGAPGLEGICVEPTLVFGPRDRALNRALACARRAHFIPLIGQGEQLHQPVFVSDIGELVSQAIEPGAPTGCFAIGGPERMSQNALLGRTLAAAGLSAPICHVPLPVARFGAELLRWLPGELLSPTAIDFMQEDFVAELDPLRAAFSLSLTPLEEGLRTYLP
jgi:NADH dehydrogenase